MLPKTPGGEELTIEEEHLGRCVDFEENKDQNIKVWYSKACQQLQLVSLEANRTLDHINKTLFNNNLKSPPLKNSYDLKMFIYDSKNSLENYVDLMEEHLTTIIAVEHDLEFQDLKTEGLMTSAEKTIDVMFDCINWLNKMLSEINQN